MRTLEAVLVGGSRGHVLFQLRGVPDHVDRFVRVVVWVLLCGREPQQGFARV